MELACGTGRLTIPIAKEHHDIMGLDISKPFLKHAEKKASEEDIYIDWIRGDMRRFSFEKNFGLIFVSYNSIHHILTLDALERVLKNVKEHLKKDGRFIVEFFNPDLEILNRDPEEKHESATYQDPDSGGEIKIMEKTRYHRARQLIDLTWFYESGDEVLMTREWTIRAWFPKEVDTVLKYNGFKIEHKYGDFDKTPFTNNSGQQIIVCKKDR